MSLRVVTYNIRLGIQEGVEAIADAIAWQNPDIVALQEVGRCWTMGPEGDTTAELADLLGLHDAMHVAAIAEGDACYGHALLSRWPSQSHAIHPLPQEIDEPRLLLETIIETPGGKVRVLSTHLSHIDDRPPQGDMLVEHMRRQPEVPTIIMGDLNAVDTEPFIGALLATCDDADATARPTFPAVEPTRRIDYILARDGVLLDCDVGKNTTASDHRWVAASWSVEP